MGKKHAAKPTSWKLKDQELAQQQKKDNERKIDMIANYLDGLESPHSRKKNEQS